MSILMLRMVMLLTTVLYTGGLYWWKMANFAYNNNYRRVFNTNNFCCLKNNISKGNLNHHYQHSLQVLWRLYLVFLRTYQTERWFGECVEERWDRPRLLPYCKRVELIVKPKKLRKAYFQGECPNGTSSNRNNPFECIAMCKGLGYSFAGVKFFPLKHMTKKRRANIEFKCCQTQHGNGCFCGNTAPPESSLRPIRFRNKSKHQKGQLGPPVGNVTFFAS